MRSQTGFTLLEAVVALAIFSMGATALFTWINTELISLNRIHAYAAKSEYRENAIEFMQAINTSERPSGSSTFGRMTINWTSGQPQMAGKVLDDQGQITINDAALYRTQVRIFDGPEPVDQFTLTTMGIVSARESSDLIFQ